MMNPTQRGDNLSLHDAAVQYAEFGWLVLPLKTGTKEPIYKGWPSKATNNVEQVAKWWSKTPSANIGILAGEKSGFIALDIDPKNGGDKSLSKLLNGENQLPETATQKTGSGGTHTLFKYPDDLIKTTRGRLGTGIDICSDKSYIVVSPSIHPNGIPYAWENDYNKINPCPPWLLDLLNTKKITPLQTDGIILEGRRNHELFRIGCSLRAKGTSKKNMGIELHTINACRCAPPLPDNEVNGIIDSVNQKVSWGVPPLFRYRNFIRSTEFPSDPTLRSIINAITFYMDVNGKGAYPTEEQLAQDTSYSRGTVSRKLTFAVEHGLIERRKHQQKGQNYWNYIYILPFRFRLVLNRCDSKTGLTA
jgi:hypothetical protein